MTLRENFEEALKRNSETGCLEWQRSLAKKGYGQLYSGTNNRPMLAHRYAWERANGAIPQGLCVCHKCDNPKCCNVEHLFLGTKAENNADMTAKGRAFIPATQKHKRHHNAKLNAALVEQLRERNAAGESQRKLANEFGMSQSSIGMAIRGETWASGERRKPIARGPKVSDMFDQCAAVKDGCLIWQKAKTNGYGCLSVAGRPVYAHRFAWERAGGTVPDGMFLQHACGEKLCVNPTHLRLLPKAGTR